MSAAQTHGHSTAGLLRQSASGSALAGGASLHRSIGGQYLRTWPAGEECRLAQWLVNEHRNAGNPSRIS